MSPGGHTKNQIDHVVVGEQLKQSVLNVRSYREVSGHSDHFLVKVKLSYIAYKITHKMKPKKRNFLQVRYRQTKGVSDN